MSHSQQLESPQGRPELACLQAMAVFGGVPADALVWLIDRAERVRVPSGGLFFREGDPGTTMYVLLAGRVAVTRVREGREESLGRFDAGDCFGEMALLDLCPRSATVRAVEDSVALAIDNRLLYRLYEHAPEPYTILILNLGRELSRRLRKADERLFRVPDDRKQPAAGTLAMASLLGRPKAGRRLLRRLTGAGSQE